MGARGLRAQREHEKKILSELDNYDDDLPGDYGVLLSHHIRYYAERYDLIKPFDKECLKPAAYELTVGTKYSIRGENHELTDKADDVIRIEPFHVAIVQTQERLNLPNFLIARWNIRVDKAYEGLLWVGGAQVDPGWRGFLSCPLYNLSSRTIELRIGEKIAVIDFVSTMKFNPKASGERFCRFQSIRYKSLDDPNRKVIFEEYKPEDLQCGLATHVWDEIKNFRGRIDAFSNVTLTSIAILMAAVAAVAVKAPQIPWDLSWLAVTFLVVAALLGVSLYVRSIKPLKSQTSRPIVEVVLLVIISTALVTAIQVFVIDRPMKTDVASFGSKSAVQIKSIQSRLDALEKRAHLHG